jgi:hypothetical protein
MKKNGYNQLKNKCNIRVEKSARIIGVIIFIYFRLLTNSEFLMKDKFIVQYSILFQTKRKVKNWKLFKVELLLQEIHAWIQPISESSNVSDSRQ